MAITITDLKAQLNVTFSTDDTLIQQKLDAAIAHTESLVETDAFNDPVAAPLVQAVLMLAAHMYENREASIYGTGTVVSVPLGYSELITGYRTWAF